jgi:hypothetical protein
MKERPRSIEYDDLFILMQLLDILKQLATARDEMLTISAIHVNCQYEVGLRQIHLIGWPQVLQFGNSSYSE